MANRLLPPFFREGYETGRFERVLELLAPDCLDHSLAGAKGSREAVAILRAVREMFSDLQITVLDLLEEGDRVASHVRFQAVHSGPCMGIEATGKAFSFSALENFRIQDGKIVESWGYWPDAQIASQLQERPVTKD